MSDKKYRLVTRSDFDGLACAILLNELNLIDDIKFVHPKDMQDGKVEITNRDITTNLPYVAGAHLVFDHHASETVRNAGGERPKNYIIYPGAPSAARVVYECYGGASRFPHALDDMMIAVDKGDAAEFSVEEILNPTGWVLLNYLMDSGRQPVFTDAAIQACLTLKALFGLPLRQTTGMVASLLDLAGLNWPVPDFSTLCRRQRTLTVHIPFRPSTGALHLLIDSTGMKAEGDGEWLASTHGPSKPRDWRKVHLGIDARTLEIRAIEITGSRVGDAPMLPELLDQIPDDQPLGIVTADGAYDTRACHAAIAARGAAAVIPPRKNGKPWKELTAGATARNDALRSCRCF